MSLILKPKEKNKSFYSGFFLCLIHNFIKTPEDTGVCCIFTPELYDGLGLSLCHVSGIRRCLISIAYTPHCCLAGLCRQVCVGAESKGTERKMRHSCMQGCERIFLILQDVGVFGRSAVDIVLNGFLNIRRVFVGAALAVL